MKRIDLLLIAAAFAFVLGTPVQAQKVTLKGSSKPAASSKEAATKGDDVKSSANSKIEKKSSSVEKENAPKDKTSVSPTLQNDANSKKNADDPLDMTIGEVGANAQDDENAHAQVENAISENTEEKTPPRRNDKLTKSPEGTEDLMPIPSAPLAPMTDAERDAKYPIVQPALEMTLEELTPTKELRNIRVLKAMARIPRAEFVPKDYREFVYQDAAIPIGEAQTISPPFIVAYMTEALDPQPTDRVLEIGTGSGYQAAVLSCLVSEVYSIEIVKTLGRRAADTLKKLQYGNVFVRLGDGYKGWPEAAPFDKIIVTCSPEDVPQPLIDQLKEGGKMLIPIGERYLQYFVLCEKKDGELVRTTLTPSSFVPMTGEAEALRGDVPDPTAPSIIGGGFEKLNPTPGEVAPTATWKTDRMTGANASKDSGKIEVKADAGEQGELNVKLPPRRPTPEGWFSTRNIYVAERNDAFEGTRVCVCDNAEVREEQRKKERNEERFNAAKLPEERDSLTSLAVRERQREQEAVCHLRQNFAIDGTEVKKLTIGGAYRVEKLFANVDTRKTVSLIKIYFFDKDRKPVRKGGEIVVLTAETTPCAWTEFSEEIQVPSRATEASLQVGILDGVGVVELDALEVKNSNERTSRGTKKH